MPFSETCFNELAWAFFCETSNPRCAMQQPKLAFIPHHYAVKTSLFRAKSCTFVGIGHQCGCIKGPTFAHHRHNNIDKKHIDNGKLEI